MRKKTEMVKTAPRLIGSEAEFYRAHFDSLNQGLELVMAAFPTLHRRALAECVGKFEPGELKLIIDVFNVTVLTSGLLGQHLAPKVNDGCSLEDLDKKWGIDRETLLGKIAALTSFQSAALEIWAVGYWQGGHYEDQTPEAYVDQIRK